MLLSDIHKWLVMGLGAIVAIFTALTVGRVKGKAEAEHKAVEEDLKHANDTRQKAAVVDRITADNVIDDDEFARRLRDSRRKTRKR